MSSEGKEPGAVWQDPNHSSWESSLSDEPPADYDDSEEIFPTHTQAAEDVASSATYQDVEQQPLPAPTLFEQIQHLGQYATLLLIPLVLGGLTSLLALPAVAKSHPDFLWLISLIIIIVTIAQGLALYWADQNKNIQILATIGGLYLFLLIISAALSGPIGCFLMVVLLLGVSIYLSRLYLRSVPDGSVDVAFAFGKYSRTLYPGLNALVPWETLVKRLNTGETHWLCPMQRVQLSRTEDILLRATISYQLQPEDAYLAITQVKNWEESLREYFIACLQNLATTFSPDDFIAWPDDMQAPPAPSEHDDSVTRRDRINHYLYQQMRDKVALWGVFVHDVVIRDVMIAPHGAEVPDADVLVAPPVANGQPEQQATQGLTQKRGEQTETIPEMHTPTKAEASPTATPTPPLNEEVYKKTYKEVQEGRVTDPVAIRKIAATFQALADDPDASQKVSFDAARAALNLYEQAQKYEEREAGTIYSKGTKRDWPPRQASDENLLAGG